MHTHIHTVSFFYTSHLVCSLGLQHHTYVNTDEVFESCLLLVAAHTHCQLLLYGPSCVLARPTQRVCIHTFTLSAFLYGPSCVLARPTQRACIHTHCQLFYTSHLVCSLGLQHHTYVHTDEVFERCLLLVAVVSLSAGHLACSLNLCNACAYTHSHLPQCRPSGVLTQPMQRVCIHTWTRILNGRCCWWTSASHGEGNVENPPEQCKGQLVRWSNHTYAHTCCMHMLTHVYVPVH